jgi:hypothetical protein
MDVSRRPVHKNTLVQPLFDGPLDIVGDVHGDSKSLRRLMGYLGYDLAGGHPDGRRLVFVGDLTDRGPDSPGVIDLIQYLVQSRRAQCVLGNHDLNILLGRHKYENEWFFGEESFDEDGCVVQQEVADDAIRDKVLAFFRTLPLALERDDLRIIHACWDDAAIDMARLAEDVVIFYGHHYDRIENAVADRDDLDGIDKGLEHQNRNPVKLLTSGPEERTEEPILSGGKVRHERRVFWWNDYQARPFCVFGHYSLPVGQPRGNEAAFCVDFGVGKIGKERRTGNESGYQWKLAALRFPEKAVMFDDGHAEPISPPAELPG